MQHSAPLIARNMLSYRLALSAFHKQRLTVHALNQWPCCEHMHWCKVTLETGHMRGEQPSNLPPEPHMDACGGNDCDNVIFAGQLKENNLSSQWRKGFHCDLVAGHLWLDAGLVVVEVRGQAESGGGGEHRPTYPPSHPPTPSSCLPFVMHPPHLQSCHWLVRTNHRAPRCLPAAYQFGQDDIKFLVLGVKDHMKTDVLITGSPCASQIVCNYKNCCSFKANAELFFFFLKNIQFQPRDGSNENSWRHMKQYLEKVN